MIELRNYQIDAIKNMKNGCILCGGVGSGKSRTALAYYYILNGGKIDTEDYSIMNKPMDLYIITTAMKRDGFEWEKELIPFKLFKNQTKDDLYSNKVIIDSWQNIKKYTEVTNSFFIFDEQRVVGYGEWAKSFIKISRSNKWILLSATPGDKWEDYIPVFIANGFYKNKTDFSSQHLIYHPRTTFPLVMGYLNQGKLIRLRKEILVDMDFRRPTVPHNIDILCDYDKNEYRYISEKRFNIEENRPVRNASECCYLLRKLVNSDISRQEKLLEILKDKKKVIIFYNFNCERDILRSLKYIPGTVVAEWNGDKHEPIPDSKRWVYLVQYAAGCEGWNCIKTDTIIFYSQNYSYKVMIQASGRIDRMNTPFKDLYFYHFKTRSGIDNAIAMALSKKKKFNEKNYYENYILKGEK